MKTVTLYWNQYTNGGAVDHECWQAFNADRLNPTYGSCYSLCEAKVEVPDNWSISDITGQPDLYDEKGYQVIFSQKSDVDAIYVYAESQFPKKLNATIKRI